MSALPSTAVVTTTMRASALRRIGSQVERLNLGAVRVFKSGGRRRHATETLIGDLLSEGVATVVVESISRLHPVPAKALATLAAMRSAGLRVVALSDAWASNCDPDTLGSVVAFLSAVEQRKNSRAGRIAIATARVRQRPIGRPRRRFDLDHARSLIARHGSIRAAAQTLGIGETTLRRALRQ